jgi:hypothetical protein
MQAGNGNRSKTQLRAAAPLSLAPSPGTLSAIAESLLQKGECKPATATAARRNSSSLGLCL